MTVQPLCGKLELALALFMVVAWRIQMLMRLGRTCPDMGCESVFEPEEWRAAYIVARNTDPERSATAQYCRPLYTRG